MLRVTFLGFVLQLVLQTGSAATDFCDNMQAEVKNHSWAFNILCPEGKDDQHLHRCCSVIEQDLRWHKLAYKKVCLDSVILKSCADLYKHGIRRDGVHVINPDGLGSFRVRCDMQTDGGGWTIIQRRQDGSENFLRGWSDYKTGFGDINREFWLGLDKLHRLTKSGQNVLRIDLTDFNGVRRFASYGFFEVADASHKYTLQVGSYSGNAGDSLSYHNQMKFSTEDNDNDKSGGNCARNWKAGWWYKSCAYTNLNGLYLGAHHTHYTGNHWRTWKMNSLKNVEMKVRPSQF